MHEFIGAGAEPGCSGDALAQPTTVHHRMAIAWPPRRASGEPRFSSRDRSEAGGRRSVLDEAALRHRAAWRTEHGSSRQL